jgi:hypothetical protein
MVEHVTTAPYQVTARPSGKYWHVDVPSIGRVTQAKTARDVAAMAKELITIMTGQDNPEVSVDYGVSPDVAVHLRRARQARAAEDAARETAARELRAAARALRDDDHLTLADVGAVLGVSHQRAHQLLTTRRPQKLEQAS